MSLVSSVFKQIGGIEKIFEFQRKTKDMSFPFGGFKKPKKQRKGRYSKAMRSFEKEMDYDEGDPDHYRKNLELHEDPEAQAQFEKAWEKSFGKNEESLSKQNLTILALGQSHMDIAWLWRLYQIVNKSRITHGKAAWHVLNMPEYSFTYSQPVMLDWLRKDDPKTFDQIKEAVKTGRFELEGGTYVETDGKIPMGESWCRSRLYGQNWYMENFGKTAEIEWLPDSFGYNNNIPQFASKSGAKYFYTQKITGNFPPDEFPFAHFKWKSPDGSELIAYNNNFTLRPLERWHLFSHTRRILKPGENLVCNYFSNEPKKSPKLDDIWEIVALVYGTGDGGHGPTSHEIQQMKYYIEKGYIDSFTTAREYFNRYDEIEDRLPVWEGAELFYNLHRGTLTTQALMKKMNRFFEWTLTGLETMHTFLSTANPSDLKLKGARSIHDTLHWLWKDTLLMQFHDILPGSSIPEVYDDCYDIWQEDLDNLNEIENAVFQHVENVIGPQQRENDNTDDNGYIVTLLNATDFQGFTFIEVSISNEELIQKLKEGYKPVISRADGEKKYCQYVEKDETKEKLINRPDRLLFCADIPSWGVKEFLLKIREKREEGRQSELTSPEIDVTETDEAWTFQTPKSYIEISKSDGLIVDYRDRVLDEKIFSEPSNRLRVFRDWFLVEQAWNIGPGYREMPFEADDDEILIKKVSLVETGPVRWTVETQILLPESETIMVQKTLIYPELRGVYFEIYADWKQKDAIVKNEFSLNSQADRCIAEGPYTTEIMTCDPDEKNHLEAQRWEACHHTWFAMPSEDDDWGISIINNSKYGFDMRKNVFGLTVIRGPKYPDATGYAAHERLNRIDDELPTHADQEEHIVEFAVTPYEGSWHHADFKKYAHYYNRRAFSRISKASDRLLHSTSLAPVIVDANNLEIVAAKMPEYMNNDEKEIVLRIIETGRKETEADVVINEKSNVIDVEVLNLLERKIENEIQIKRNEKRITSFRLKWNPHEIHTIRLVLG